MTEKTKAAVLVETKKPLEIMDIEIPALKAGQVLVDVAYSGICHSQINEARGLKGPDRYVPHCMGHEGTGTIVAVGEGVSKVKEGDRVILSWLKGSGADVPGTVYQSAIGPVNSGAIASFMKRTVTCENRVTVMDDKMPMREAALIGCAIPTGAGLVLNTMKIKAGQSIAVFGAGGIGISATMAAAGLGASPIIVVDMVADKLETAKELGATHVINAAETDDVVAAIKEITDGKGVDFAAEATGVTKVMSQAFRSVRDGGGLCVLAGNPPAGDTFDVDPFDLIKGKRVIGTWGGETAPDTDYPRYMQMYLEGKLPLEKMVSSEYAFEDINQALDDVEAGKVIRAMVKF